MREAVDARLAWYSAEIAREDIDEDEAADHMNDRVALAGARTALQAEHDRR